MEAAEELAKVEGEVKLAAEREDVAAMEEAGQEASAALEEFQSQAAIYGFEDCSDEPGLRRPSTAARRRTAKNSKAAKKAESKSNPNSKKPPPKKKSSPKKKWRPKPAAPAAASEAPRNRPPKPAANPAASARAELRPAPAGEGWVPLSGMTVAQLVALRLPARAFGARSVAANFTDAPPSSRAILLAGACGFARTPAVQLS